MDQNTITSFRLCDNHTPPLRLLQVWLKFKTPDRWSGERGTGHGGWKNKTEVGGEKRDRKWIERRVGVLTTGMEGGRRGALSHPGPQAASRRPHQCWIRAPRHRPDKHVGSSCFSGDDPLTHPHRQPDEEVGDDQNVLRPVSELDLNHHSWWSGTNPTRDTTRTSKSLWDFSPHEV